LSNAKKDIQCQPSLQCVAISIDRSYTIPKYFKETFFYERAKMKNIVVEGRGGDSEEERM